jgi:hypothetical protein
LILQEFQVGTLGFEHLKDMYYDETDLKEEYEACENLLLRDKSQWTKYMIQEGLLFKGNQLCIPKCSMRDNLLKEKNSGGSTGHFGHDKTFAWLRSSYYWPSMRTEVLKFVNRCRICQHAKGKDRTLDCINHCQYQRGLGMQ